MSYLEDVIIISTIDKEERRRTRKGEGGQRTKQIICFNLGETDPAKEYALKHSK